MNGNNFILFLVQRTADSRNEFECVICFETYSLSNSKSFGCTHLFCKNCLVEHLSVLIKEGRLDALKCPQPKCNTIASEQMIKQILPRNSVDRYNNLQLKRAVEEMDDIVRDHCFIITNNEEQKLSSSLN
jgi:E3 ubiquitin-protein ligase RNF14